MNVKRRYRCPVIGSGTDDDDRRPSVAAYPCASWSVTEDFQPEAETIAVEVTATEAQHAVIAADPDIETLP